MGVTRHLTYANVVATAALVVTLGGTSYAALHVGTNDIEDGAVTSAKIAAKAVTSGKINDKAVKPAALDPANPFPVTVNNAKSLGGYAAAKYLRANMAQTVFQRTQSSPTDLLTISGFGKLGIGCSNGAGFGRFTNTSSKPIVVTIASSGAGLRSSTLQKGQAVNGPNATSAQIQTWRVQQGDPGSKLVGTAWIALVKGANKACSGSIQAISEH
jgi:hypothetical protein